MRRRVRGLFSRPSTFKMYTKMFAKKDKNIGYCNADLSAVCFRLRLVKSESRTVHCQASRKGRFFESLMHPYLH
jgi:hypothetical protein